MNTMTQHAPKPDIIISEADERSLTTLVADTLGRSADIGEELLAEIERARVVPGASMSAWRRRNGNNR